MAVDSYWHSPLSLRVEQQRRTNSPEHVRRISKQIKFLRHRSMYITVEENSTLLRRWCHDQKVIHYGSTEGHAANDETRNTRWAEVFSVGQQRKQNEFTDRINQCQTSEREKRWLSSIAWLTNVIDHGRGKRSTLAFLVSFDIAFLLDSSSLTVR
jgi:hypothetical protein